MELTQLRTFREVAETLSFTRASLAYIPQHKNQLQETARGVDNATTH